MDACRARNRSCTDLMEFVCEEGNTVTQYSPCKLACSNASPRRRGQRKLFGDGPAGGASPTAVADRQPNTASQPSSATSSLAALADLQVSSRHSSASDLGDRRLLLAFAAAQARPAHSRSPSGEGDAAAAAAESGLCSPVLIGAVRCFDTMVLKTLTPIKTRSRATSQDGKPGSLPAALVPSPLVAYADNLVSPFSGANNGSLKPKGSVGGRPMVIHSRGSSGMAVAPGAYNPYDLTAAALSTEYRSPARVLYSPYPSSHTSSSTATSLWGSGTYRGTSYRAATAAAALAQAKEADEPDCYVSVPGVRRQQSMSQQQLAPACCDAVVAAAMAAGAQQSAAAPAAGQGKLLAATAQVHAGSGSLPGAASPSPLKRHPSDSPPILRQASSSSSATLGSGTTVHGFKGLFRNVIARGCSHDMLSRPAAPLNP